MQTTSRLLMIRPVDFSFNTETAVNNAFQQITSNATTTVQQLALKEFEDFVTILRQNDVDVFVVEDTGQPHTPDSIFPNNWISFHESHKICLYPMFAPNRRLERKLLPTIKNQFHIQQVLDLSFYEAEDRFLEGTGSMVLDRDHTIAYACISPRTSLELLTYFCDQMNYKPVSFLATDRDNQIIYHTNVMMCVADAYAVVCLESIRSVEERKVLQDGLQQSGKEVIPISLQQLHRFAGNMLQVNNHKGEKILVMSTQAFQSLSSEQIKKLQQYNRIIHSSLETIESNGGGSARCMMAEVFL